MNGTEGKLYKNECGRYALDKWTEFRSGSGIELKLRGTWVTTCIEHDGKDYYAVGLCGVKLDGLTARVPGRA